MSNHDQTSTQKEIGGYFELDTFLGENYHAGALKLHCGRACLAYLIEARGISKLWVPDFLCASIDEVCKDMQVETHLYPISSDFQPALDPKELKDDEYLYLVNYYGQLPSTYIQHLADVVNNRLIVDNVMAYFEVPLEGIDTLYSCRKFFGVADGGELYTNTSINRELDVDSSLEHMQFVLGRYERSAGEFFAQASANNSRFAHQGAKRMSLLTQNILRALPFYEYKLRREQNFDVIHESLHTINKMELHPTPGPFMYPLLVDGGDELRSELQRRKIFAPKLWPYCQDRPGNASYFAHNIVPIPIDQRYEQSDMEYIATTILDILN